jgi:hypothetical protein
MSTKMSKLTGSVLKKITVNGVNSMQIIESFSSTEIA